jgi:glucose-1-phosphatase
VLDFGNVVAFFDHRLTTNRLAPYAGVSADALHDFVFRRILSDYETGRLSTNEFLTQVRQVCRLSCTDEFLIEAWTDIFWPNRDLINLLPQLEQQYRLLLASNTNALHTQHFCRQFDHALQHFHARVFSHEVGAAKPDRAFYERCRRLADCAPSECLFVDDMPANVAGALAYGWNAFVYKGVGDLRVQFAEFGIEITAKLSEIKSR